MPSIKKYTLSHIRETAEWVLDELQDQKVIALHGHMGAGKTTLISALCEYLGVTGGTSSPTFSIINEYPLTINNMDDSVYHIDLYRLKNEEEAIRAGVEDCIYSGSYCFVEWPERAPGIFPPETAHIYLYHENENKRSIKVERK
ncbi:tRNA (adenosine(37)-N6)-threonylcarbamoyltransferase complex ATPase subunit type 1 TsaE [Niabella aquatica]